MKRLPWALLAVVMVGGWAYALTQDDYADMRAGQGMPDSTAEQPPPDLGGIEGEPGGHGEHKESAAEYILHHVADAEEFELEVPIPPYHLVTVPLGHWFSFLRFESQPGACEKPVPPALTNFPGIAQVQAGCWDLRPTKAVLMMWLAFGVVLLFVAFGRKRDQNGVPRGLMTNLVESLALFVRDEIVVANIGKKEADRYTPYFMSLFFFLTFTNWLGLIPGFFSGTGVIMVTAAMAMLTFVLTQIAGIRSAGLGGYLAHLTGGVPAFLWFIMIPVEVLGLFTKPFALLVRLFANMLGGHMVLFFLLSLIFVWDPLAVFISVPLTAPIYFLEMFVGILQAYIFTLLSALYISQGVAMGHHHHEAHEEHAH